MGVAVAGVVSGTVFSTVVSTVSSTLTADFGVVDPHRTMRTYGPAEGFTQPLVHAWRMWVNINAIRCRRDCPNSARVYPRRHAQGNGGGGASEAEVRLD